MADEVFLPRRVPQWVQGIVMEHGGYDFRFLMEKEVQPSDLDSQQSRLSIKKAYLDAHILPFLNTSEKSEASLLDPHLKKKKYNIIIDDNNNNNDTESQEVKKKKAAGRAHGGLRVPVFTRNRWMHLLELTRWDTSALTILKGSEWSLARAFSCFQAGDKLVMWGFRRGPTKELCLVVGNKRTMYH